MMRQHGSFHEVWEGRREIGIWRMAVGHGKGVEGVEGLMGVLRGHTPRSHTPRRRKRRCGEGDRRWGVVELMWDGGCCM